MDITNAWNDIVDKLMTTSLSTVAYEVYFANVKPYAQADKKLVLAVALRSHKKALMEHYRAQILEAMKQCNSYFEDFDVILDSEKEDYSRENIASKEPAKNNEGMRFGKQYTFDNFVVGDSNRFASAAAMAVAEAPGEVYNPMFIYSRPGLGKTHLLNAIGNDLAANHPELKVLYITAENFTNDYIYNIRNSKNAEVMQDFNNKYRGQDVLMIDDVQFFERAEKTQETLFHIFNDLYANHKQIILSSDRPVRNLTFLDERLASRFASGIVVNIETPTIEDRIAILQKKAQNLKMQVADSVLYYLAETEKNNIRILEGMLNTVHLYAMLNKRTADSVEFAKEALHDSVITADDNITVQAVVNVCCNYFNIKKDDLLGKRRNKEIVEPRQYAIYIITQLIPSTPLTAIGDYFDRDRSTVISARDKIGRLVQTDNKVKRIVEDLKNLVLNN